VFTNCIRYPSAYELISLILWALFRRKKWKKEVFGGCVELLSARGSSVAIFRR